MMLKPICIATSYGSHTALRRRSFIFWISCAFVYIAYYILLTRITFDKETRIDKYGRVVFAYGGLRMRDYGARVAIDKRVVICERFMYIMFFPLYSVDKLLNRVHVYECHDSSGY